VISQMEIAAVRLRAPTRPAAGIQSGYREPTPGSFASRQRARRPGFENTVTEPVRQVDGNPSLPKSEIYFHHDHGTTGFLACNGLRTALSGRFIDGLLY